jgi:3-dehydroquinate synthase
MKRVKMALGERSYDIRIGADAIQSLPGWLKHHRTRRAFIVADRTLTQARAALKASLTRAGWEAHEITVDAGEGLKDFRAVYPIYGKLLKAKARRDSVLLALGGGSIGDAAGFVAATYLRGISWVGLPTTLLAQVDSSVGGKTGINHTAGKNLIGAFHQPELVVCDTNFLKTLSGREVVSGLGEVIKYGLIYDPAFFSYLEKHSTRFLKLDRDVLTRAIEKSVAWKCKAVSKDEFDRKGVREALNFGHTFAHALEAATRYKVYQHGEAVLWGMRFALALSQVRGKLDAAERVRVDGFLAGLDVPAVPVGFGPAELFELMTHDKKVRDGKIHFVLLDRIGRSVSDNRVKREDLFAAYRLLGIKKGAGR